ncbi:type II toxin-antitoxin system RelE/ParE family toxin [Salinimicrobium sediminilitoris]|uniref:type II toxin-antitoxin system RelE/ParE family toxin n=1 Tax=Salinimicrobium sediminilitoris TaxID=2876715 RepID=UPI001E341D5C|nr:type II toxin-antitoxin system RelE/ParE family toxin [Salinimicrobium sediminilitoris]MCC8358474.1 type II toxin-antitoxin system RelE/ParE family toxin [Salinimicrobium sediminilitoris]
MATKVVWTHQAVIGLEKVMGYLEKEWTVKEIISLNQKIDSLIINLQNQPELFKNSHKYKKLRKALIDKNNYLIYKWIPAENKIIIINFRGAKQRPIY